MFSTEYLAIIDQEKADALYRLCTAPTDFERLLTTGGIVTVDGTLSCTDSSPFPYTLDTRDVQHKKQRCFHISISCSDIDRDLPEYLGLRKQVRATIVRAGGTVETLWDDISLHFSERSYPIIHRTENLMRKLITYFMLTTIGKHWVSEASPSSFQDAVDKNRRQQYSDALHQVDFIHLADCLFKAYSPKTPAELISEIKATSPSAHIDLERLHSEYIPQSNWERYFSEIVECEDDYLRKRWKRLYDLRCQVAHNTLVTKANYEDIARIAEEVDKYIQKAIDGLGEVRITDSDREQIAESIVAVQQDNAGDFLEEWRALEHSILLRTQEFEADHHLKTATNFTPELLDAYQALNIIDEDIISRLRALRAFRNKLVHSAVDEPAELEAMILAARSARDDLRRDWRDEITGALRSIGGEGSLAEIYEYLADNCSREKTGNWKAIVRYTINRSSSDTETFRGGADVFRHVGRGRWALR